MFGITPSLKVDGQNVTDFCKKNNILYLASVKSFGFYVLLQR